MHAGVAAEATLVLVADAGGEHPTAVDATFDWDVADVDIPPVALVRGPATTRLGVVRTLVDGAGEGSASLAAQLARRVTRGPTLQLEDGSDWSSLLAPGDVTFVSTAAGEQPAAIPADAPGVIITTLSEGVAHEADAA